MIAAMFFGAFIGIVSYPGNVVLVRFAPADLVRQRIEDVAIELGDSVGIHGEHVPAAQHIPQSPTSVPWHQNKIRSDFVGIGGSLSARSEAAR